MSDHDELDTFSEDETMRDQHAKRQPGAALPVASIVLCLAGAAIGYYLNWIIGAAMLIASIVCGALALRRRAPYRWLSIVSIVLCVLALIFTVAVVSVIFYRVQQMDELLASASMRLG